MNSAVSGIVLGEGSEMKVLFQDCFVASLFTAEMKKAYIRCIFKLVSYCEISTVFTVDCIVYHKKTL